MNEKEVIHAIKEMIRCNGIFEGGFTTTEAEIMQSALNLIEKQQKEIFEVKKYCTDKKIVSIGVDYGAGQSKTKFITTGITYAFQDVYKNSEVDELCKYEYYYPPYVDDILNILKEE